MKPRYDGSEEEGKSKRYNFTTNKEVSEILEPIKKKAEYIREAIVFYHKHKAIQSEKLEKEVMDTVVETLTKNWKEFDKVKPRIFNSPEMPIPEEQEIVPTSINTDNLGLTEDNILTHLNPKEFIESFDRPILATFYRKLLDKTAPTKKPYIIRGILGHYRKLGKL